MRSTRDTVKRRSTALPGRSTISIVKVTPPPQHSTQTPAGADLSSGSPLLPYSAHAESLWSASYAHEAALARRRWPGGGRLRALYSGLVRYMRGPRQGRSRAAATTTTRAPVKALHPGDVLRDFPYFTQASEISFFSTHPSLCDAIFTVGHGDRLRFGSGQWATQEATVVGARGGHLWIVLDGESIARQLPAPDSLAPSELLHSSAMSVSSSRRASQMRRAITSEGDFWIRVEAYYAIQRLSDAAGPLPQESAVQAIDTQSNRASAVNTSSATTAEPARAAESGLSSRILARVDEAVRRVYSAEQRSFLQRAPDLFVSVVSEQESGSVAGGGGGGVHSLSPFLSHASDSGAESPLSPFQGTPLRSGQDSGSASPWGNDSSTVLLDSSAMPLEAEQRGALRAPLPLIVSGAEQASSLYAMVAQGGEGVEGKVVILAPRILAVSGAAGWAGEGTIVAEAGGIQHFKASLSASLVCS